MVGPPKNWSEFAVLGVDFCERNFVGWMEMLFEGGFNRKLMRFHTKLQVESSQLIKRSIFIKRHPISHRKLMQNYSHYMETCQQEQQTH